MSPRLDRADWVGMYTGLADEPNNPALYHYAANMIPSKDGSMIQRPPLQRIATALPASINAAGTLRTRNGLVVIRWAVVSSSTGSTPTIWTEAGGVWSQVVSSADFVTAGITITYPLNTKWCTYSDGTKDYIVFAGSNIEAPWAYDGTAGAASLTKLTNAPLSTARPTPYGGKLFFIMNGDPRTLAWSDEFAINVGYDLDNQWTLAQTSNEPITSILGTNDGLYFARPNSVGRITGNVTDDFATTATQDAVSVGVGTLANLIALNDEVWFYDQADRIWYIPFGGRIEEVVCSVGDPDDPSLIGSGTSTRIPEPFGFGLSEFIGFTADPVALPQWLGYYGPTIWFPCQGSAGPTTGGMVLVVDAAAHRAIGWQVFGHTVLATPNLYTFGYASLQGFYSPSPAFIGTDDGVSRIYVLGYDPATGLVMAGGDENNAGVAQNITYRFIPGPVRFPESAARFGDLMLDLFGTGNITGSAGLITNRNTAPTTGNWTVAFGANRSHQPAFVGWEDEAEWGRFLVSVTSSSLSGFGIRRLSCAAKPVPLEALV